MSSAAIIAGVQPWAHALLLIVAIFAEATVLYVAYGYLEGITAPIVFDRLRGS